MVTVSPLTGIAAPVQVLVKFQLPDCAETMADPNMQEEAAKNIAMSLIVPP
jgi:hypothetical protein